MGSDQRRTVRSAAVILCVVAAIGFAAYQIFVGPRGTGSDIDPELQAKADQLAAPAREQAEREQAREPEVLESEQTTKSHGPMSPGG